MGSVWHGIIMVSELYPSLDWAAVRVQLLDASRATDSMFHVLDLQELRFLVGVSENNPVRLMAHLVHRFQVLSESKSAYIRTRLEGPPLP